MPNSLCNPLRTTQHPVQHPAPYAAPQRALIVAADRAIQRVSQHTLQRAHWQVDACHNYDQFQRLPRTGAWPLVVVADDRAGLPEQLLRSLAPEIADERSYVIVLTPAPSVTQAIQCLQLRAFDYLPLPLDPLRLLTLSAQIQQRAQYQRMERTTAGPPLPASTIPPTPMLIGQSAAMLALIKQLVQFAPRRDARLLLSGETGTGKEIVARKLHELSGATGPFLAVNCAAMTETLLEAELFGYEKGAFTGALQRKVGLWEAAENGTLFLDEITEAGPAMQAKLLRALQENVIRRVGATHESQVNARVIAASNRDLGAALAQQTLREDLYYRFGQIVRIPPLRERREDIPLLAAYFCERSAPHCVITPAAMNLLCSWHWPGNVRELAAVIEQLTSTAGSVILPEHVLAYVQPAQLAPPWLSLPLLSALASSQAERLPDLHTLRNWYVATLDFQGCSQAEIARTLALDPRTVAKALQEAHAQFPPAPLAQLG